MENMGSNELSPYDLIVASAANAGITLKQNATNLRVATLPRLSLAVMANQRVPLGDDAARNLRKSVTYLSDSYTTEEITAIEFLAKAAEQLTTDYHGDRQGLRRSMRHPLGGLLNLAYYYPACVSRLGEHPGLRIVRALLLRTITYTSANQEALAAAKHLRQVLVTQPTDTYDSAASPALVASWQPDISASELAARLAPYLGENSNLAQQLSCCVLETRANEPSASPNKNKPSNDPEPHGTHIRPKHPAGPRRIDIPEPPPAELDVPSPEEIPPNDVGYTPTFWLPLIDDAEADFLELGPQSTIDHANFEYTQATRQHLEGILLPDTDRCLSMREAGLVWTTLEREFLQTEQRFLIRLSAVGLGLMLLTARSRGETMHALLCHLRNQQPADEALLQLSSTHWMGTINLDLPNLRDLPRDWFDDVKQKIRLPLPTALTTCLNDLTGMDALNHLPGPSTASWDAAWDQVRAMIRDVVPRFTETRAIHTLPIAIYCQTSHTRDAQWVAGSDLFHPTAPLHYYSAPQSELIRSYSRALVELGIPAPPNPTDSDCIIGAPRSGVNWAKAKSAIDSLHEQTQAAVRLHKAPITTMIQGVTALGLYTAVMYAACTAHRFTASVASVSRDDILALPHNRHDPEAPRIGLTIVADKSTHPDLDCRACALPPLFLHQLDAYIRQLQRMERRLSKPDGVIYVQLRAAVKNALAGRGPLWFSYDSDKEPLSGVTELDRHAMARMWPQWAVPLPLLRHLFASQAGHFGVAGHDIALQMGHAIDGVSFDASDPDTPIQFATRLAQPLNAYLSALGLQPIATVARHDPPEPLHPTTARNIIAVEKEVVQQRRRRDETAPPTPSAKDTEYAKQLVDSAQLRPQRDGPLAQEWGVSPKTIKDLLKEAVSAGVGVQVATRALLTARIDKYREQDKKNMRRYPTVPPVCSTNTQYSQLCRSHIRAARWAIWAETAAISYLEKAVKRQQTKMLWAAAAVLLPLYGCGCTTDRLLALMSPATPVHGFDSSSYGVFAEIPLPNAGRNDPRETQMISRDATAILTMLRRATDQNPTETSINSALKCAEPIMALLDSSTAKPLPELLRVIALARQIHAPGTRAAWERGALSSVGLSLHRLAPLWGVYMAPKASTQTTQSKKASTARTIRSNGNISEPTSQYIKLRRLVYDIKNTVRPTTRARELERLHQELSGNYGRGHALSLLTRFTLHVWREQKLKLSTAYTYLTSIGRRVVTTFDATPLDAASPDDIEQCLRNILITSRVDTQRQTMGPVAAAIVHFIVLLEAEDIHVDGAVIFDGIPVLSARKPGYCASPAEINEIYQQLATSTEAAAPKNNARDAALIAESMVRIQLETGLRIRESAGLMKNDIAINDEELHVNVRPLARRGLKRPASKRLVVIPVSTEHGQRLQENLAHLHNRRKTTGDLLFAVRPESTIDDVTRITTSAFRNAATPMMAPQHARTHVGRHNRATAAQIAVHDVPFTAHLGHMAGVDIPNLASTERSLELLSVLPPRVRYRYVSRQLGHGSAITTSEWYGHALSFLESAPVHFHGISRTLEAALLGRRQRTIETWRTRHVTDKTDAEFRRNWLFNPEWMNGTIHRSTHAPVFASTEATETTDGISCLLLARIALCKREGIEDGAAANEVGIHISAYRRHLSVLSGFDRSLRLHYLSGRRHTNRGHTRLPDAHRLLPFFGKLDLAFTNSDVIAAQVQGWLFRQQSGADGWLLFGSEDELISELLAPYCRRQQPDPDENNTALQMTRLDGQFVRLVVATYVHDARRH